MSRSGNSDERRSISTSASNMEISFWSGGYRDIETVYCGSLDGHLR
jgi:hypothetical protein